MSKDIITVLKEYLKVKPIIKQSFIIFHDNADEFKFVRIDEDIVKKILPIIGRQQELRDKGESLDFFFEASNDFKLKPDEKST